MTPTPDSGRMLASRALLEIVDAMPARAARKPRTRRTVSLVPAVARFGAWLRRQLASGSATAVSLGRPQPQERT